MPIVASVSGGWRGCPGRPRTRSLRFTCSSDRADSGAMDHRTGTRTEVLVLDAFEELEEGRVLVEEGRNLLEPGSSPIFDPGLRQVVGDVVEAAFAHVSMIGRFSRGSMGRPAHS